MLYQGSEPRVIPCARDCLLWRHLDDFGNSSSRINQHVPRGAASDAAMLRNTIQYSFLYDLIARNIHIGLQSKELMWFTYRWDQVGLPSRAPTFRHITGPRQPSKWETRGPVVSLPPCLTVSIGITFSYETPRGWRENPRNQVNNHISSCQCDSTPQTLQILAG